MAQAVRFAQVRTPAVLHSQDVCRHTRQELSRGRIVAKMITAVITHDVRHYHHHYQDRSVVDGQVWWSELAHSLWYDPYVCPHGQPTGEGRLSPPSYQQTVPGAVTYGHAHGSLALASRNCMKMGQQKSRFPCVKKAAFECNRV